MDRRITMELFLREGIKKDFVTIELSNRVNGGQKDIILQITDGEPKSSIDALASALKASLL